MLRTHMEGSFREFTLHVNAVVKSETLLCVQGHCHFVQFSFKSYRF